MSRPLKILLGVLGGIVLIAIVGGPLLGNFMLHRYLDERKQEEKARQAISQKALNQARQEVESSGGRR